ATGSVAVAMGAADGLLLPAWSVLTARNSYVPGVSAAALNCAIQSVVATFPLANIRTALRPIIRACCGFSEPLKMRLLRPTEIQVELPAARYWIWMSAMSLAKLIAPTCCGVMAQLDAGPAVVSA